MGHNNLLARESAVLLALDLIYEPYVWGGDNPDEGMDCSGFVGYWLKQLKVIPPAFDTTAQGYYRYFREFSIDMIIRGALIFYGKNRGQISHVMVALNGRSCIGAVGGNKYIDSKEMAREVDAKVDVRPIYYRKDMVAIVDPLVNLT